jgi:hypothetical protein
MGVLLMLVGLLGLASGGLKLRTRVRQTTGYSQLAVVEALLGAATLVGSGIGLSQVRPLAWTLVLATLSLILASSWVHAGRVRRIVERRKESEALRLETFLHTTGGDPSSAPDKRDQ